MGYYTYHGDGYGNADRDTSNNILIGVSTACRSIPIHVIAGLASQLVGKEPAAFVRALCNGCRGGAGCTEPAYDGVSDWRALGNVRCNPRQRLPLPRDLPFARLMGYCSADLSHPKEPSTRRAARTASVWRFRLYDAQAGEVRLLVNWKDMETLAAGPANSWGAFARWPSPPPRSTRRAAASASWPGKDRTGDAGVPGRRPEAPGTGGAR